jgi:phage terminase small subunit
MIVKAVSYMFAAEHKLWHFMQEQENIGLPPKQELFCRNYVANGHNGAEAAISAGYAKNSARITASKLLTKANIQEFIKTLEEPILDKLGLDENWVTTKLKNFADVKITDFFEVKDNSLQLKDFSKIPQEKIDAIESIKETKNGIEIKLVDKRACVVDLGKNMGMFKDQSEANINHNLTHRVYVLPAFSNNADGK